MRKYYLAIEIRDGEEEWELVPFESPMGMLEEANRLKGKFKTLALMDFSVGEHYKFG